MLHKDGKITLKRKDLAPFQFKIFAILIGIAINYKFLTFTFYEVDWIVFFMGALAAAAIWTSQNVVVIDTVNRHIGEGFLIFGIRYIAKTPYTVIEKIFVNKITLRETFRPNTRTITVHHEVYKAFLKTSDGTKFWIAASADKQQLFESLGALNTILQTQLIDSTGFEAVPIA